MAIDILAGSWQAHTGGASLSRPSCQAGDLVIIYVSGKAYASTFSISGYTAIPNTTSTNGTDANALDAGSISVAAFYRYYTIVDASPSLSVSGGGSNSTYLTSVVRFRPTAGSVIDVPVGHTGNDTSSGTDFSCTMGADIGIAANDALMAFSTIAGNNATFGTPTLTAADVTMGTVTEYPATEGTTANGYDLEASAMTAFPSAGPSSAAAVVGWTLSAAQTGISVLVRVREHVALNTPSSTPSFTPSTSPSASATPSSTPSSTYSAAATASSTPSNTPSASATPSATPSVGTQTAYLVQAASNEDLAIGGGTQISVDLNGITAGNLIVVAMSWYSGTCDFVTEGSSYLTAGARRDHSGGEHTQLFYLLSANSGNRTFTAGFSVIAYDRKIHVLEFKSGGGYSWAFDAENWTYSALNEIPTDPITTTGSDDVVIGFAVIRDTVVNFYDPYIGTSGDPNPIPQAVSSTTLSATYYRTLSEPTSDVYFNVQANVGPLRSIYAFKTNLISSSPSASATPSETPSTSPSASATPSETPSATPSASATPSETPSTTPSASATPSETPSATPSASSTPSNTPSSTPSHTPSASATPSLSPSTSPSPAPMDIEIWHNGIELDPLFEVTSVFPVANTVEAELKLFQIKNTSALGMFLCSFTTEVGVAEIALGAAGETYAQGAGKVFQAELTTPYVATNDSAYVWLRWKAPVPHVTGQNHIILDINYFEVIE